MGAETFEHLMRAVSDQLPLLLDVDVATVGFEPAPSPLPGLVAADVRRLPEGAVDRLAGKGQDVALHHEMADDGTVFAAGAGLVRSAALARLRPAAGRPVGLLALGSRGDGVFHTGQGTELVAFLARVLERCIENCLEGLSPVLPTAPAKSGWNRSATRCIISYGRYPQDVAFQRRSAGAA